MSERGCVWVLIVVAALWAVIIGAVWLALRTAGLA